MTNPPAGARVRARLVQVWLPGLVLVVVALLAVAVTAAVDAGASQEYHSIWSLLVPDPAGAAWTMALVGTAEGVAIAIVIVVVVLGVQLTADRYSPRIIDIFVRDPMNGAVLALFLGSIVFTTLTSAEIKSDYVPLLGVGAAVALAVVDFAVLLLLRPLHVLDHAGGHHHPRRPPARRGPGPARPRQQLGGRAAPRAARLPGADR